MINTPYLTTVSEYGRPGLKTAFGTLDVSTVGTRVGDKHLHAGTDLTQQTSDSNLMADPAKEGKPPGTYQNNQTLSLISSVVPKEPNDRAQEVNFEQAYYELKLKFKSLEFELEHSRGENRALKEQKSQIMTSMNNLRSQNKLLMEQPCRRADQKILICPLEAEEVIRRVKAECGRCVNFLYKQLERYIVELDQAKELTSNSEYQSRRVINKLEAENNALRLQLAQKSLKNADTPKKPLKSQNRVRRFSLRKSSCLNCSLELGNCFTGGKVHPKPILDNLFLDYHRDESGKAFGPRAI